MSMRNKSIWRFKGNSKACNTFTSLFIEKLSIGHASGFNFARISPRLVRSPTILPSTKLHQQGMTKWGWLFTLIIFVTSATTFMRVAPNYLDFNVVKAIAERLPAEQVHDGMSRSEINDHFKKQFRIENFQIKARDVLTIDRNTERTVIDINYEVREHLFYNVDVVMSFEKEYTFE